MTSVLVIDDSLEFCEMLTEILAEEGFQVNCVGTAEEAFAHCEQQQVDLILCDLVLPVADLEEFEESNDSAMVGVSAIKTLSERYPMTPIIAISGQMVGDPLRLMTKFGAAQCLSKPFSREQLLQAIGSVLA